MRGMLNRYYAEGGEVEEDQGSWDMPPAMGAMTQSALSSTDAQRLAKLEQMRMRMFEQQQARKEGRNGGINLPLLSAAGAFFAPTKGGGFGESLSNAVSSAVPLALQERKLNADEEKTTAQQEWNREYQRALIVDRMKGRDIQGDRASDAKALGTARIEIMQQNADTAGRRADAAKTPMIQFDKPVVAQVPDEDGNPTFVLAQQHRQTGQWVTADENREPLSGVKGLVKAGETPIANDPNVERVAKMIAEYKLPPLSGFVLKTPFGQAVLAKIGDHNDEYSATEYGARSKAFRDFATGPPGNVARFINVGISHIGTMRELVDALNNGDIPIVNKVANKFAEVTGQPAPTSFDAAKQIVGQEIVKSVVGASAGTGEERKSAADKLLAANSPRQLHEALNTYVKLLEGQLGGLRQQYERTTRLKNFDSEFLSPEVHTEIKKAKRSGGVSAAQAASAPIMTEGEYDLAPKGAPYRLPSDPPNVVRTKQ